MKTQNIIIAVVAILVIAGIAFGVYFSSKSNDVSSTLYYNANSLRSGSLLDRLQAEQQAGLYNNKNQTGSVEENEESRKS